MNNAVANKRNGTNLARFIVYEVQAWMGDCLLVVYPPQFEQSDAYSLFSKIYRLYHVCGRRWSIVAVPCAMCSALVGEWSISSFESVRFHLYDSRQVCGLCLLRSTVKLNFLDPESMRPFHTWAIVCFALTFG